MTTEWQDVLASTALPVGAVVELTWREQDLLLYRTPDGKCRAITAYCPHMGNYMPNGLPPGKPIDSLLSEEKIRCPYHGWCFDGDGHCTHIPQGQRVPLAVKQGRAVARSWQVRERHQQIQLAVFAQ